MHVGLVSLLITTNVLQEIVRVPPLQVFQGRASTQAHVHRYRVRALPQRERPVAEVLLGQRQGELVICFALFLAWAANVSRVGRLEGCQS